LTTRVSIYLKGIQKRSEFVNIIKVYYQKLKVTKIFVDMYRNHLKLLQTAQAIVIVVFGV
jgi:hypothetical protein